MRIVFLKSLKSDSLDKFFCPPAALLPAHSSYFQRHLYIMGNAAPGHQRIFLCQISYFEARASHRAILVVDFAGGYRLKPGNNIQQGRFTTPARSYDDDKTSLIDL